MDLIYINREIVKMAEAVGLVVVDDVEFLQANVLWIEQLYKSKNAGNKSNDKHSFYANLNLYELNANKLKLYEKATAFSEKMLNDFLKDDNFGYQVKVEKRKEELRKVYTDVGKLYQYSFTFIITANEIKSV